MSSPNPVAVAWSIARSLLLIRKPEPNGSGHADASRLTELLAALASNGTRALAHNAGKIRSIAGELAAHDPDRLSNDGALAFWVDLYNAGALGLAARAASEGRDSVLRVPGGFRQPFVEVAGEHLSLDAIEHAKIRRFRDPRVHAALVCGSVSCPTLRSTPFSGSDLDGTLDDQMRRFLAGGGATVDHDARVVTLSRVFSWYGGDFVRPGRMPAVVPASRRSVLIAISPWLDPEIADATSGYGVTFQSYDWGLRCSVG